MESNRFNGFEREISSCLYDFLWPKDLKRCLFAWTCIGIVFIIIAFFISERLALFLYNYSFCISPGTSFGKVTTLLAWLLCSYPIAYVSIRRKWRPSGFRSLLAIFLTLVLLLSIANLLVFRVMFRNAGGEELRALEGELGGRLVTVGFRPEAVVNYSSSTLEHTHSLKPVLYWLFNFFIDADRINYDIGAALYALFPAPWVVAPIVIVLLVAYLATYAMILMHTANEERKSYLAWLNCLVFSLASFSFFESALDGGPLTTSMQTGAALLVLYLLMRYVRGKRGERWTILLIFAPLLLLAAMNFAIYDLAPRAISLHEHFLVSSLGLAAAGLHEFRHTGVRSKSLIPILFLLAFNLSSFRPYSAIRESGKGDNVYMILSVDPSMPDDGIVKQLVADPDLAGPEVIARSASTVMVKATVTRAGISSWELCRRFLRRRSAPLESNIRFRFGNPSKELSSFAYLPVDEGELRQALPARGMIEIISLEGLGEHFVKVECAAPEGLYSSYYLALVLHQHGLSLTHYMFFRSPAEKGLAVKVGNFLRTSLPVTRLQPIVGIIFP
jgi:hypothetical protein